MIAVPPGDCGPQRERERHRSDLSYSYEPRVGRSSRTRMVIPSLRATARGSRRTRRSMTSTGLSTAQSSACESLFRQPSPPPEVRRGSVGVRSWSAIRVSACRGVSRGSAAGALHTARAGIPRIDRRRPPRRPLQQPALSIGRAPHFFRSRPAGMLHSPTGSRFC
jgi:hypothetical protein